MRYTDPYELLLEAEPNEYQLGELEGDKPDKPDTAEATAGDEPGGGTDEPTEAGADTGGGDTEDTAGDEAEDTAAGADEAGGGDTGGDTEAGGTETGGDEANPDEAGAGGKDLDETKGTAAQKLVLLDEFERLSELAQLLLKSVARLAFQSTEYESKLIEIGDIIEATISQIEYTISYKFIDSKYSELLVLFYYYKYRIFDCVKYVEQISDSISKK